MLKLMRRAALAAATGAWLGVAGAAAHAAPVPLDEITYSIQGRCGRCNNFAGAQLTGTLSFTNYGSRQLISSNFFGGTFQIDNGSDFTTTNNYALGFWGPVADRIASVTFNTGTAVLPATGMLVTGSLASRIPGGDLGGILNVYVGGACTTAACTNTQDSDNLSIFTVTAHTDSAPAPIPLPAPLALLLAGIAGLAGVSTWQRGAGVRPAHSWL